MRTGLVDSCGRPAVIAAALRRAVVTGFGALMLAAPADAVTHSHSPAADLADVSIDELKSLYLMCDRAAVGGQLSSAAIMQCSVVYEELKRRAFGGDFGKMLAWSEAHPSVPNTRR